MVYHSIQSVPSITALVVSLIHAHMARCIQYNIMCCHGVADRCLTPDFQQYFSYFVISFIGRGKRSTQRKPLTCRKSLTIFITYFNMELKRTKLTSHTGKSTNVTLPGKHGCDMENGMH
jgi:hypothetical protein